MSQTTKTHGPRERHTRHARTSRGPPGKSRAWGPEQVQWKDLLQWIHSKQPPSEPDGAESKITPDSRETVRS